MKTKWYNGVQIFAGEEPKVDENTDTTSTTAQGTNSEQFAEIDELKKSVKEHKGLIQSIEALVKSIIKPKSEPTESTQNIGESRDEGNNTVAQTVTTVDPTILDLQKQIEDMKKQMAKTKKEELEHKKQSLIAELGIEDESIINELKDERSLDLVRKVGDKLKNSHVDKTREVTEAEVIQYLQKNPQLINVSKIESKIQEATTGKPKKTSREIVSSWKV
jgi:hypothetical protein